MEPVPIDGGELYFLERLEVAGDDILSRLIAQTGWCAESITVWGKRYLQPRLIAWHGSAAYRYSGMSLAPLPFTPLQLQIREAVRQATGLEFNSVLLNYYRDGNDSMGFHSDDENELGHNPVIASVSFGAPRLFILKHKRLPTTVKIPLGNGSLLVMAGQTQANWRHGINKSRRFCAPRVNLTFRNIV